MGPNRKSPKTTTRPAATSSMTTAKTLTLITIDRCEGTPEPAIRSRPVPRTHR
ncbi:Uncharacterised protein [Mycobacterium tuberculosis]|nr:Uncharacterised protein [Mycobacterium tuberculosis]